MWEGVGDWTKTATYWPPSQLFWLSQSFFPVLLCCSTGGLAAQPLLGHGSHSCIFSPSALNFLSPGLYHCSMTTQFNPSTAKAIPWSPDIFDRMHLLFTQVHFFFWQLGRVGGQYATLSKRIQLAVSNFVLFILDTLILYSIMQHQLRQLHKNAACNLEQVLAATPHKTPTVRPPASYHENYSS